MLTRRTFTLAALSLSLGAGWASAQKTKVWTDAEVMKVHRSAILIDTHNDVTSKTVEGVELGKSSTEGHTDIPRMKQGGMTAEFFAAYVATGNMEGNKSAHRALQMIDTIRHDIAEKYSNEMVFTTTAAGIVKAKKQGKIAALIGIEGGHAIEDDVRLLRDYYALGVRYMTLTHTKNLSWAGSSGEKDNQGINELGRQVIAEMNRLGIMVDIAHVSDKTFWDALEASKAPIFSSHSSCRSLSNIPRNMTDEMIQALAKKDGVVQINFGCEFLSQKSQDSSPMRDPAFMARAEKVMADIKDPKERRAAMRKLMSEMGKATVRATIDDVVAHIDHVKKIAGIDYVGLGSDFDGVGCVPEGLDDVSKWPNLTRKLLEKGYTPAEIRKVYGGNLLRVMTAVEKAAAVPPR
ncbi:MAG TPA: dipeptidase [Paludibaculum sp.]|jgi:membrane dipeptidase